MAAKSSDEEESHSLLQEYIDSSTSSEDILLEGVQAPAHVPCSWRDKIGSILGEIRFKELPERVRRGLLYALPETMCVMDAPRFPSSTGSASVVLPEQGAAAALQARLVNTPGRAKASLLVPHCHPAVTHVQLALACCHSLLQLAEGMCDLVSAYGVRESAQECAELVNLQKVVLDLLNEIMTRAGECLSDECPDSTWGGVQLAEDHAGAILHWVIGLDFACVAPLPQPLWRQGAVECIADDVVKHSDKSEMVCFDILMNAANEGLKVDHLAEVLALRSFLLLPRLPLKWVVHQPSKYELRPSRVLLHLLWEQRSGDFLTCSSQLVHLPLSLSHSAALDHDGMFTRVMSQPGVIQWLRGVPFDLKKVVNRSTLLYLKQPAEGVVAGWDELERMEGDDALAPGAPDFQEVYARLMVICTDCALLMVDVHWEPVPVSEKQASMRAGPWSGARGQGGRGCEIQ